MNTADGYKVLYLDHRAKRVEYAPCSRLETAETMIRRLNGLGRAAWVETTDGTFVPVKGAMQKPAELAL